jgi:hypothetical protein
MRGMPGDRASADRHGVLDKAIPRRTGVSWRLGIVLAVGFAAFATLAITAEHWLLRFHAGTVIESHEAPFTVRAPMFAGYDNLQIGGGVVVMRGETATRAQATIADAIADVMPRGPVLYLALFALIFVLATIVTHHMRRSIPGRVARVQIVTLVVIAVLAVAVKIVLLSSALSALVVPIAALALVPTMVLDRIVGLATGVLAALVVSLLAPFDVGLVILLLVQAATAGLVVSERPKQRWLAALGAGLVTTLCTSATYLLLAYLTTGRAPELGDPLHATWLAAAIGPAIAAVLAVPLIPVYQLLVGEITQGKLFYLEDLGHPLLRQIAERSPGTWQHSLMMANMAEIAANAIGANGRLVRVGAYFHDLGKSLQPTYFIENLEPGATSPHDQLPPEVSCDAIFAHVTEGIVTARKAGLHERIIDFMHMHHGNGVLEYFWAKCREQGNPHDFTIDDFRYPGHPPQSRETAILAICDAVEAASRTLKKPDAAAIDSLVQRIVYGKLHLGQLDESGLSMSDLRQISDSLRETIRHANHGRIEYPWQKAEQDASASVMSYSSTAPRLDSLDRKPDRDAAIRPPIPPGSDPAFAATADLKDPSPKDRRQSAAQRETLEASSPAASIDPGPPRGKDQDPPARTLPFGREVGIRPEPRSESIDSGPQHGNDEGHAMETFPLVETERWGSGLVPKDADAPHTERAAPAIEHRAMLPVEAAPALIHQPPVTIPGRAAGPLPPPPDPMDPSDSPADSMEPSDPITAQISGNKPPPAALTFDFEPPPAAPTFDFEGPSAAHTFDLEPLLGSRTRAASSPPAQPRRPPSGPRPLVSRRPPGEPARVAEPPAPVDLDNAITNPPPLRRGPSGHPPRHVDLDNAITNPPPLGSPARTSVQHADPNLPIANALRTPSSQPPRTTGLAGDDQRPRLIDTLPGHGGGAEPVAPRRDIPATDAATDAPADTPPTAHRDLDPGVTEPSLPTIAVGDELCVDVLPPPAPPASSPADPRAGWASGLAARIDAALDGDEWSRETPIAPPSKAELSARLGQPDPKRQPVDQIASLQRRGAELGDTAQQHRSPHPTTEVDPDDIEAAIELVPPARRPTSANSIGVARPKKSE